LIFLFKTLFINYIYSEGQLGDNSLINKNQFTAVYTAGILNSKKIIKINSGTDHTCAISDESKIYCWGRNKFEFFIYFYFKIKLLVMVNWEMVQL
jgi:alpha-tubulin suppressor-like RCC1 family protein